MTTKAAGQLHFCPLCHSSLQHCHPLLIQLQPCRTKNKHVVLAMGEGGMSAAWSVELREPGAQDWLRPAWVLRDAAVCLDCQLTIHRTFGKGKMEGE